MSKGDTNMKNMKIELTIYAAAGEGAGEQVKDREKERTGKSLRLF